MKYVFHADTPAQFLALASDVLRRRADNVNGTGHNKTEQLISKRIAIELNQIADIFVKSETKPLEGLMLPSLTVMLGG